MPNEKPGKKLSRADLLEKAKKSFKVAYEADQAQRERENEDLRFQVAENQWTEKAREERAGGPAGPARPMLSISLLTQPGQLIQNQAANAHLGVDVQPVSEKANKDMAEVKQGLYRRIERDSNAHEARLWALDRAKQAGRGWYRVNTQWDEDGDSPFDQEIVIERILRQDLVFIDPAAQKADFSDARFGIVAAWVPIDTFKEEWPNAEVPTSSSEFSSWATADPEWVKSGGEDQAVLVAEYYYKEFDREDVTIKGRKRIMERVRVKYCKLTAREVLEQQDYAGHYIPLIPVLGRELQPFDGERRWEGIVRPARDGQMFFNFAASSLLERMALEPKAPFVGAEGQFAGHEEEWAQINTRNLPYAEYKPTSHEGLLTPPPMRAQLDSTGMSLALQALAQAQDFVQSATAVHEPSLGDVPRRKDAQSGRAILALQQQSDAGTGHFLQSLAKVSMAYESRCVLDLMPAVYDRPGRVTQILGPENKPKMVMLGRPFIPDQEGRPQPWMPPAMPLPPPGMPPMPSPPPPPEAKTFDLTQGKYAIAVSVGKSFQTRMQEGRAEIGAILEKQPQLMPMIGDIYYEFQDFPGSKEIGKRLGKMREKQFPGLGDDEEPGVTLEQLQAQNQQMEQQLQELGQKFQAAVKEIETDRAKQEATIAKTQMDNQTKEIIARLEANTELLKEAMRAQVKTADAAAKSAEGDRAREAKAIEGELGREHETKLDVLEVVHEQTLAEMKAEKREPGELEESET